MSDAAFWRMSATELLAGYARHDFSPVEVLRELYERVERLNPKLSSFLALNTGDALASAQAAEEAWRSPGEKPLLLGVPVSIKDSIEVDGMPTTYGSLPFKDNRQPDAELVRRVRQAGGVITGKTNLPEFALYSAVDNKLGPPGRNPWDLERTCGGSSGGAGSSLASGLGPLAVGTDSGGSVRTPAAVNGVFALKPTYQRIPAVQTWRAAPGRSHNGPMTRTVGDAALLMQALAGADARDAESNLPPVEDYLAFASGGVRGVRVAVSYDFGQGYRTNPDVLAFVREAAALFAELGCEVVEADPPTLEESEELEPGVWAYSGDHYAAAEAMIPNFIEKHLDDLTPYTRPIYERAPEAKAWQYRRILRRNRAFGQRMQEWFRGYDFLLSPLVGPAVPLKEATPRDRAKPPRSFVVPFNHTYNPAAAVPFGLSTGGLPISVQVVGRLYDDVGVLRMAAAVERVRPWAQRWPALAEA